MGSLKEIRRDYFNAVYDTNREKAFSVIENALAEGIKADDIIFNVIIPSIDEMTAIMVNEKGAALSQHYICSIVSGEITDMLLPLLEKKSENAGTIILGTAFGDFHGLGKKIVGGFLKANLFNVIDLGINVSPEKFVDEAVEKNAEIIGISSMMIHTACGDNGSIGVRKILDERKLSGKIKLIAGGSPFIFDHNLYKEVKADGWAENGIEAVSLIKGLLKQL